MTDRIVLLIVVASLLGLIPVVFARSKRRQPTPRSRAEESAELIAREGLRRLAEDAGVVAQRMNPQWRPVGSADPRPRNEAAEDQAPGSSEVVAGDKRIRVGQLFSPAAPISRQHLFAGRHQQMEDLVDVAFERGRHAVVFGERGVGKTSMATVMLSIFGGESAKLAIKVNCDASDSFDAIWRNVFEEFEFLAASNSDHLGRRFHGQLRAITSDVPKSKLSPNDVRRSLRLITGLKECVIFIDEFERLKDPEAPELFADTLKMLSDQQVPATIIIVGVADNVQELLSGSRSIERALRQVYMPRMSPDELQEIVHRALALAGMTIQRPALDLITAISHGLPHFTHLIGQGSARATIDDGEVEISNRHVDAALALLVDKTYETIIDEYRTAVFSHRETLYPQVLLAAAMAETDEQGFFAAANLVSPLSRIAGKPYDIPAFSRHLHALAEKDRGPTLQRKGTEHRYRFRFANPLLQPYVLMKGLTEKMISAEDLTGGPEGI